MRGRSNPYRPTCKSNATSASSTRISPWNTSKELRVVGVSDSTARQVERALTILAKPGFPRQKLVSHQLALQDIHRAFELMLSRDCQRVILIP